MVRCKKKRFQSKGIGKRLLDYVVKQAKKMSARIIYVESGSLPMFKKANNLYKGFGFKPVFRIRDYWDDGDDLILFVKRL